ncbi:hypothetical protein [Hoylesella oralis]|uniref:hypothetical protein n=1 Tax=Hoylesella oralis TaxID=28134 RepID=UPI0012DD859F|nr:hypothetical protein [Hoylesella oralis]
MMVLLSNKSVSVSVFNNHHGHLEREVVRTKSPRTLSQEINVYKQQKEISAYTS